MGQQVGMEDQEWAAGPEWGWHGRGAGRGHLRYTWG